MTGTLLNVAAVLLGATIGLLLGGRLPERIRTIALQAVGLVTLLIGMQMALQVQNILIVLASMVVGGVIGETLAIERRMEAAGDYLERRIGGGAEGTGRQSTTPSTPSSTFVRGFVTSSLVFCVGPLTILGSIQDGLTGDFRLLAVKSLLDGFTAIAFASALGAGVFFSAGVILVYQGGLTLAARLLSASIADPATSPPVLEMTAVGGLLIVGIGLKLLDIKPIRVGNLLPAVALAPLLTVTIGPLLARLIGKG